MSDLTIQPIASIQGELSLPGDKSISHRAVLMGAMADGMTQIQNCLLSEDVRSSIEIVQALGISVQVTKDQVTVTGAGLQSWKTPEGLLNCGNSGTTARLLMGILAGSSVKATLTGDASLSARPMKRVIEPLVQMGASIKGKDSGGHLPLTIHGTSLKGIRYTLPVASAQVKSAILLAGLFAAEPTTVVEPIVTRDHTERMLRYLGVKIDTGEGITVTPGASLAGKPLQIPGDISSAAFFIVAALLLADSDLTLKQVGLNPTRTGFLDVLVQMGASIQTKVESESWEPTGSLRVKGSSLKGAEVSPESVPSLIDELPILMVAATQAQGTSRFEGVGELRVKETDRIHSMVTGLEAMGAQIQVEGDAVIIEGPTALKGGSLDSFNDHRTAMALAIAGLVAQGSTTICNSESIQISFPGFHKALQEISRI